MWFGTRLKASSDQTDMSNGRVIVTWRSAVSWISPFPTGPSPMQFPIQFGTRANLLPCLRSKSLAASTWMVLLSGFFPSPASASAAFVPQMPAYRFASSLSVGGTPEIGLVTVRISETGNLGAIHVVTQGVPNQDFTIATGGSCAAGTNYFVGQICTAAVSFQPKYPGLVRGRAAGGK